MDFEKEINKISKLARIELSKNQENRFSKDLNKILDYFSILQKVDTDNVEPFLTHSSSKNIFRKDNSKTYLKNDLLKKDFPNKQKDYLKIKSVKEEWKF